MVFIVLILVLSGCGASPPPVVNIENTAALAQYELLLDDCRKQGKAARSYAVYEACAVAVDADLCTHNRAFCRDGGP